MVINNVSKAEASDLLFIRIKAGGRAHLVSKAEPTFLSQKHIFPKLTM